MANQIDRDMQTIDDRLEAWARWKRSSGQLPVEGWTDATILGRMIDEGWAALIHGYGFKPEPDFQDEEAIDKAIRELPKYLGKVIYINYMQMAPQQFKAQLLKMTLRTYRDYLSLAKHRVIAFTKGLKKSA